VTPSMEYELRYLAKRACLRDECIERMRTALAKEGVELSSAGTGRSTDLGLLWTVCVVWPSNTVQTVNAPVQDGDDPLSNRVADDVVKRILDYAVREKKLPHGRL
jgi:hypothetical protein